MYNIWSNHWVASLGYDPRDGSIILVYIFMTVWDLIIVTTRRSFLSLDFNFDLDFDFDFDFDFA